MPSARSIPGWRGLVFGAFGLREHKPVVLVGEVGEGELLILLGAVVVLHRAGARVGEGDAEGNDLCFTLHLICMDSAWPFAESRVGRLVEVFGIVVVEVT